MLSEAEKLVAYVEELKLATSNNDKIELLKDALTEPLFKEMVQLALDPTLSYNVSKVPYQKSDGPLFKKQYSVREVFDYLKVMSSKSGMNNDEKIILSEMVSTSKELHQIANMIVKKKLDCGVKAKMVNKAVPGTIFVCPYMRCSGVEQIHRITYPAYLNVKADGMFLNIFLNGKESPVYKTRPGNIFPLNRPDIDDILMKGFDYGYEVLMGEARVWSQKFKKYLPRKIGNGILNSILQGTPSEEVLSSHEKIILTVWDIVPGEDFYKGESWIPYKDRWGDLQDCIGEFDNEEDPAYVNLISNVIVNSEEDAYKIAQVWINSGLEGGVLKDKKFFWKNHTSPYCIKLKAEKVCELRITGWELGEGKYSGVMGSVRCETEDGKLEVWVSGWTDEERNWDWDDYIGKIISVKFNEVIESKSKDATSLFLPRVSRNEETSFVEFRLDKDEADTLEEVLKK
jgi:DNA ligase 1